MRNRRFGAEARDPLPWRMRCCEPDRPRRVHAASPWRRPSRLLAAFCAVLYLALAAGCRTDNAAKATGATAAPGGLRDLPLASAPGSGEASLFAAPDGRLLLTWIEPLEDKRHALRLAWRREGEPWSQPSTVAEGAGWFVNWADFPQAAALPDGTLFAHWLEKRSAGADYDYDVRVVRSRDAGRSWDPPLSPYADTTAGEHGFVSYAPLDDERMGVLFLDGRLTKKKDGSTKTNGAMSLRFAALPRSGPPQGDSLVDARVCDCCQTALVRTPRGLVAAWRDRSPAEIRDVAVSRFDGQRWSKPVHPGAEGWEIRGCPVNGPALAASGNQVVLAWYTMAGDRPRVRAAFSDDAGTTWGKPVEVDDGQALGRLSVVFTNGGAALVTWLEGSEAGAELRARVVEAAGKSLPSRVLARTSSARTSGFPRTAALGQEIVLAWRDGERVRTALVQ